jgi:hypothetical protein
VLRKESPYETINNVKPRNPEAPKSRDPMTQTKVGHATPHGAIRCARGRMYPCLRAPHERGACTASAGAPDRGAPAGAPDRGAVHLHAHTATGVNPARRTRIGLLPPTMNRAPAPP